MTTSADTRKALRAKQRQVEREAVANLTCAIKMLCTILPFIDIRLAFGIAQVIAELLKSPGMIEELQERGAALIEALSPMSKDTEGTEVIVRLPLAAGADICSRLSTEHELKKNRKRLDWIEYTGTGDAASIRALVEPVGGVVTEVRVPKECGDGAAVASVADRAHVHADTQSAPQRMDPERVDQGLTEDLAPCAPEEPQPTQALYDPETHGVGVVLRRATADTRSLRKLQSRARESGCGAGLLNGRAESLIADVQVELIPAVEAAASQNGNGAQSTGLELRNSDLYERPNEVVSLRAEES